MMSKIFFVSIVSILTAYSCTSFSKNRVYIAPNYINNNDQPHTELTTKFSSLVINKVTLSPIISERKIVLLKENGEVFYFSSKQWAKAPKIIIKDLLFSALSVNNVADYLTFTNNRKQATYLLEFYVSKFNFEQKIDGRYINVSFRVSLLDHNKNHLGTDVFSYTKKVDKNNSLALIMQQASNSVLNDFLLWLRGVKLN